MKLEEFLEKVNGSEDDILTYNDAKKALEAVKQNGYALQYVKDQTEAICLEAVKQYGDALQYVNKKVFD
jgi:ABC-type Fe3+ transport system substrate-binding protein